MFDLSKIKKIVKIPNFFFYTICVVFGILIGILNLSSYSSKINSFNSGKKLVCRYSSDLFVNINNKDWYYDDKLSMFFDNSNSIGIPLNSCKEIK